MTIDTSVAWTVAVLASRLSLLLLAASVVHELGHLLMGEALGGVCRPTGLGLGPFTGNCVFHWRVPTPGSKPKHRSFNPMVDFDLTLMPVSARRVIAAAGPAANFGLALLAMAALPIFERPTPGLGPLVSWVVSATGRTMSQSVAPFWLGVASVNIIVGVTNLIPLRSGADGKLMSDGALIMQWGVQLSRLRFWGRRRHAEGSVN